MNWDKMDGIKILIKPVYGVDILENIEKLAHRHLATAKEIIEK
jgi:hypothetical protein